MAASVKRQVWFWGVLAALLILALWGLANTILPYILGTALAYFLDPLADRLEKLGMSRVLATVTISVLVVLVFVLGIVLVVPLLIEQGQALSDSLPGLIERGSNLLVERFPSILDDNSTLRQSLRGLAEAVQARSGELANAVLGSAVSLLNIALLIVIVPVVAFYMLLDWDKAVAKVDELLPRQHAPKIRTIAAEIDRTVASFIRGMGTVCLLMGAFYATGLMLVGLQFGLVIGAFAGLITFIPYVGAILGGVLALGFGLVQFWGDWVQLGLVGAVFAAGQMIEGNVLTPKLVGSSVGLHPVWLILALSVFGALFGFVGMLVAVPVSAALGVVARHMAGAYKDSALYRGDPPMSDADPYRPGTPDDRA
ncbi:AI-2E family transporter [Rhodobacter sp. NTK016B]|uniref:AI-2E family transporter n=1 Tax=Rhodobacter sp. NTK016B TaxID=2759676 RepID=UPI001A8DE616|nr:AI-2E family transporter [Rhodobacter sp. NTK016B]MBN8290765.1 AI-2E family transporter [Rhodobacter sp. NTK016B]